MLEFAGLPAGLCRTLLTQMSDFAKLDPGDDGARAQVSGRNHVSMSGFATDASSGHPDDGI
jgi:hypothetical protein